MNIEEIRKVIAEMRDRKVNGQNESPTLVAWANRIEAALTEEERAEPVLRLGEFKIVAPTTNSEKALNDFYSMIPHKQQRVIPLLVKKTNTTIQDYMSHGEGGKLALLHLSLNVAVMVEKDQFGDGKEFMQ